METYHVSSILYWIAEFLNENDIVFRLRYEGMFQTVGIDCAFNSFEYARYNKFPIICLN